MLDFHKEKGADCTIAVLNVSLEEASRFGIMNAEPDGHIYEFEEKPKQPKSTLASMGIYIFSWKKLRKYLEEDELDPNSSNDFGKNIITNMLAAGEKLYAYAFDGYWKDVGTIDSLWEANMDLLDPNVPLDLYDPSWKIYSRNADMPPHYISEVANVQNSMVCEGCHVEGDVEFSVLFAGATIEPGAIVHDSILMPGAVVKKNAIVEYAIIAEDVVIGEGAKVGERPENCPDKDNWGVAVVGAGVKVSPKAVIAPKAMIEQDV
jgi:glucose-1-phosphate adenylyltransferase